MDDAKRKRLPLGQFSPSSSQKGSKRRVSNVENIVASSTPLRPAPRSIVFGSEQSSVQKASERSSTALGTGLPSAACPVEDVFETRKHSRPMFGSNENLDPNISSLVSPQQSYVLQSTRRGAATPAPRHMSSSNISVEPSVTSSGELGRSRGFQQLKSLSRLSGSSKAAAPSSGQSCLTQSFQGSSPPSVNVRRHGTSTLSAPYAPSPSERRLSGVDLAGLRTPVSRLIETKPVSLNKNTFFQLPASSIIRRGAGSSRTQQALMDSFNRDRGMPYAAPFKYKGGQTQLDPRLVCTPELAKKRDAQRHFTVTVTEPEQLGVVTPGNKDAHDQVIVEDVLSGHRGEYISDDEATHVNDVPGCSGYLNRAARRIVGQTATKLISDNLQTASASGYPAKIKEMIGKEYTFDIEVKEENVVAKSKIFYVNDAFQASNSFGADKSSDVMREGLSTSSFAESKIDLTKTEDTPTSEKSVYKKIKIEG
uniref:Uncharacterized protein n=1 Tax=Daucus carota subsp. sativus TaxID=79200 RepID=A0A164ZYJ0_DAUCS